MSQQYKLGEHVVRCLSDLHTTQARKPEFQFGDKLINFDVF